ncbi:MAG TPA: ArgE/DapE family deacylase [Candidatus Lachnoclostridium pullistercoris]|uniref:ArgE/DapE family deacylase n=1 Tax=Candidatus Lachnoclostridium pullistercoris TaxID=2838632 RepID=A0A9D2PCQ7_9FIRM|nr:ArgE/DapE family deacylase [Candidatus Lachnoclostridium pullistercoris]
MDGRTEKALSLLKELIAFDTSNLPGNEKGCASYLEGLLKNAGFETVLQVMPDAPDRANVIAAVGSKKGKSLIYNGHLDVVPAGEGWNSDPFCAVVRDGKLYGRGACDMKGGVAAMAAAALSLVEEGFSFAGGQLILVFVCDEELHDMGIRHYIASPEFVKADYGVISEPSGGQFCLAHRGVARYEISVLGVSCHAGVPEKGINAMTNAGYALLALEKLSKSLAARTHEILPPPTLAPTVISGGLKDNIVPDLIRIQVDRRMLPGESLESCQKEIEEVLDQVKRERKEFDYRIKPYVCLNAGYVAKDSEIVKICNEVYRETTGKEAVNTFFTGGNDQNFLVDAGVPTLVFGPGSLDQAHTVDEYVKLEDMEESTEFFYQLAKKILQ